MIAKIARSLIVGVCLCCLSAIGVTGADTDQKSFRIDSYIPEKFVDFEWRINGSMGANGSDSEREANELPQSSYMHTEGQTDRSSKNLSLSSLWDYEYVTVPEFLRGDLRLTLNLSNSSWEQTSLRSDTLGGSDRTSWDMEESDYFSWGFGFSPGLSAGKYIVSDWFLSTGLEYSFGYGETPDSDSRDLDYDTWVYTNVDQTEIHQVYRRTEESEFRSDRRSHSLHAELLVGWGRVYTGEYASTAMYMIEELRRENLLQREPTYDEMMALTDTMYQYRQRHIVDKRIRRIEALGAVLTYLESAGAISDPGPYGYLIIQDVWDYFPRGRSSSREFGYSISAGPGLEYFRSSSQRTSISDVVRLYTRTYSDSAGVIDTLGDTSYTDHRYDYTKDKSSIPFITGKLEYHRPISRRWQFDGNANCRYYIDAYRTAETEDDLEHTNYHDYYSLSAAAYATYIYDSRTSLRLTGRGYFSSRVTEFNRAIFDSNADDPEPTPDRKTESWNWLLSADLEYRMAIPTTLHLGLSYRSEFLQSEIQHSSVETRYDGYSLSARIDHYLY
jgi:hypothetical protein